MGDDEQLIMRKLLTRGPLIQPNSEIVTRIDNGFHRVKYKNVESMAQKLANSISSLGIKPGDFVGTLMFNNFRHLLLYYTLASMGVVINALNRSLHPTRIEFIINHSNTKVMFVDAKLLPLFESLNLNNCPTIKHIIICGFNEQDKNYTTKIRNYSDFSDFISKGGNSFKWPNLDERTGLGICFTSGTTGNPKGVLYSHRSSYIHSLVMIMNDFASLSGTDSIMPLAPFFHALGWMMPYLAFLLGFKICLNNHFTTAKDLLHIIKHEEVTFFSGVPTLLQGMREEIDKNMSYYKNIGSHLKRVITGGSSPPPELINWWRVKLNVEIIQIWGMTELNPVGTYGRRISLRKDLELLKQGKEDELTKNVTCQGIPIPSVHFKLIDSDNHNIEKEFNGKDIGEILVKGPSANTSYFRVDAPDKFHNGYLITGDVGKFSGIGQMILKDRSKDMIKSGGEWISSIDLENTIMELSEVSKACVVGIDHPKWMQRPIVIVELNEGKSLTLEKVRNHCQKTWQDWQCPVDVIFMEIPLTGSGKMSKKNVRAILKEQNYKLPDLRDKKSKL